MDKNEILNAQIRLCAPPLGEEIPTVAALPRNDAV